MCSSILSLVFLFSYTSVLLTCTHVLPFRKRGNYKRVLHWKLGSGLGAAVPVVSEDRVTPLDKIMWPTPPSHRSDPREEMTPLPAAIWQAVNVQTYVCERLDLRVNFVIFGLPYSCKHAYPCAISKASQQGSSISNITCYSQVECLKVDFSYWSHGESFYSRGVIYS